MIYPKISKNIPLWPKQSGGRSKFEKTWTKFVKQLEVGDSFVHYHPYLFHNYFTRCGFGIAVRGLTFKPSDKYRLYRIWRTK